MPQTVCFTRSDLSLVRRFGAGASTSWTATPVPEDSYDSARPMLDRVRAAAAWVASGSGRRHLDRVIVDVDESVCYMVRTPSLARPVLAASARASGQDWGDLAPIAGLEPLTDPIAPPPKRAKNAPEPPPSADTPEGLSVAVISQTDAITRLWLDALDTRGVRAHSVCSFWHAMAQAWGQASGGTVTLVLLCEPERIVWAMARAEDLLCGASAAVGSPAPPVPDAPPDQKPADPLAATVRRCTLDWLAWSSQLGITADRVVIIGPSAVPVAALLPEAWKSAGIETHTDADPVGLTCSRVAQRTPEAKPTSRRSLVRLSMRPTRATRWRFAWGAASLVILGLGLGGLGYRMTKAGNTIRQATAELREQTNIRVKGVVPNIDPFAGIVMQMDSALAALKKSPAFAAPQPPPKVYDELSRVCSVLATFPGTQIRSITVASDRGQLACTVSKRRDYELLIDALKSDGPMVWSAPRDASTDFTILNLAGEWRK